MGGDRIVTTTSAPSATNRTVPPGKFELVSVTYKPGGGEWKNSDVSPAATTVSKVPSASVKPWIRPRALNPSRRAARSRGRGRETSREPLLPGREE